jgi:hypothetical protein
MSGLLDYLNNPHLVANFQKVFGIEANFSLQQKILNCINQTTTTTTTKTANSNNVKLKSRKKNDNIKPQDEQKLNENDLNKKNNSYKIHNKFWFYLFHIGAAMGTFF